MPSFPVRFIAPRQSVFYCICTSEDGLKLNPSSGIFSSTITHASAVISLELLRFPMYGASIKADGIKNDRVNVCIYERMGVSPAVDDLLLSHEELLWDPILGVALRGDDPSQVALRAFLSEESSRLDNFFMSGARVGSASVFYPFNEKVVYAKVSAGASTAQVSRVSLRMVDAALRTTQELKRVSYNPPYGSLRFNELNDAMAVAVKSGMYALCFEAPSGAVVGFGSPMPGVQVSRAGIPGRIEVTSTGRTSQDLRKF
jgi:hypothetical protein